jgi:type III pantothenate kinase
LKPYIVGPESGPACLLRESKEVGADRIVNAVAGFEIQDISHHCDFGTATTFDYVSRKGHYCGGAMPRTHDFTEAFPGIATARVEVTDHRRS